MAADGLDLSEMFRRTVQVNARLYKGWVDLSLEYFRGITEIFGGSTEAAVSGEESDAGSTLASALVLEGEEGTSARGAFLVTNDLSRSVSCEFVASAFKDSGGAVVHLRPAFDPASLELARGEKRVIQVTMPIDGALAAGVGYTGEFSIRGMDGFSVPVVVRRRHLVEDSPIDQAQSDEAPVAGATDERELAQSGHAARKETGKRASHRNKQSAR